MEKVTKMTPEKKKPLEIENLNPNEFSNRNPLQKSSNKAKNNCVNVSVVSPQKRIRQRKFVVAKKKKNDQSPKKTVLCKCGENSDGSKCVCEAMEETRNGVPENGKVMHLVKDFERLLSIKREKEKNEDEEENEKKNKVMKQPVKDEDELSEVVSGLDQRVTVTSSWDCGSGRSVCSRNSSGGRRSRRNSLESSSTIGGRRWKKKQKLKVTSQKPFKLRTEQRGKMKEEQLMKKVKEILTEEEKMRIPIAQGLPWTIDEPECLLKPPVKESTKPIDVKLHSDLRAIDRAEFDHQVAEKLSLIEQQKMEMERQQKLAEEEEIRRLRKELIPKAQPMPYFDRPFIPRRSMKNPTIPKEPMFHIPHHKKIKCLTLNEMRSYSSCFN